MSDRSEQTKVITRLLKLAILFNSLIVIVQTVGGIFSNSLGLLSDAAHNFTDTAALILSYFALLQTLKPPTTTRTFGFHRSSILAAFLNSFFLILMTLGIFYQAYERIVHPQPVNGTLMYGIALLALIANGTIAWMFQKTRKSEINAKMAFIHMLGDALVSLGVVVAGLVITYTQWIYIDPIISMVIGLVIAYGTFEILKESIDVLMEGVPREIQIEKVIETISSVPEVKQLLDLHIWTVGSNLHLLNCHILVHNMTIKESEWVRETIRYVVSENHAIDHMTIELEVESSDSKPSGCNLFSIRPMIQGLNQKKIV